MVKWERNRGRRIKPGNRNQSQSSHFLLVDFVTSLETQSNRLGK